MGGWIWRRSVPITLNEGVQNTPVVTCEDNRFGDGKETGKQLQENSVGHRDSTHIRRSSKDLGNLEHMIWSSIA